MFGADEGGGQVDVQRILPARERDLRRRLVRPDGAGVVQRDVQPAEALDRRLHQAFGQSLVSDVSRHRDGATAFGLYGGDQGRQLDLASGGDDHGRALP
ncbi:hypothetical protein D3C72_2014960 [compost metagenome]